MAQASSLTNGKLLKTLKTERVKLSTFRDNVYALSNSRDERLGDIISRIGTDNKTVAAYTTKASIVMEMEYEADRRSLSTLFL